MGIYDRDYYRREGPSVLGSFAIRGQVCRWLLGINIALFVGQLLAQQMAIPFTEFLSLEPRSVVHGEIWRLLSYAFLHDTRNIWHIVFNMWMLWLFGSYMEDLYGRWEFLAFYLTAAVVGGLAYVLQAALGWSASMEDICIGASGAVMALTILCAFHYPTLSILLFFVLPVPIWIMAMLFVVQDTFGLLSGARGVAFSVHLGGAAFAALYYKMHWRVLSLWPNIRGWKIQRSRPRLRVFHGDDEAREPVPVAGPPLSEIDEHLEAKVDAVLAKVARSGQESLTDSEKQLLLKASEIYKKRRS